MDQDFDGFSTENNPTDVHRFVYIGPECFADKAETVISYKSENFYRACGAFVHGDPEGAHSTCVKRVGHPGNFHEDYDGRHAWIPIKGFLDDYVLTPNKILEEFGVSKPDPVVRDLIAWDRAREIVDAAIEKLGIEDYKIGPNILNLGQGGTRTKLDQYLDLIIMVADWLLGEDE